MMSDKEFSITKGDITNTFLRSNLWQGSWNFERMHALGFMYTMVPTLKRLYPENNDERKAAMRRHLEFFNTQPFMAARSEEHTSELQSRGHLVCRLLLEKKNK